jgi:hypothetical protein
MHGPAYAAPAERDDQNCGERQNRIAHERRGGRRRPSVAMPVPVLRIAAHGIPGAQGRDSSGGHSRPQARREGKGSRLGNPRRSPRLCGKSRGREESQFTAETQRAAEKIGRHHKSSRLFPGEFVAEEIYEVAMVGEDVRFGRRGGCAGGEIPRRLAPRNDNARGGGGAVVRAARFGG